MNCVNLTKKITETFNRTKMNRYEIANDEEVAFKMLRSNETLLQNDLNFIRTNPKKFICLNDNFDHNENADEKNRLKLILKDFYRSLFPKRSAFELDEMEENEFNNFDEYLQWLELNRNNYNIYNHFIFLFFLFNIILLVFIYFLFFTK